ncbi:RNA helicase [Mycobacterium sp. CBMA271]|uniref:DEAD/DEAH box helicase n=1 Tax=unclassified Mycobacteroides TaxID=2618759 RepID=UPI00132A1BB3|nr:MULTISPECIES: RNA helicase [unclassified Mycobacteroides]MUM18774.1 DEAD/DEAH box helicase [Mycobacteroides sp. CBMA 326]MUM22737.1 RNA helicase [Mycobacteroides sp. CBMA 271]
MSSNTDALAHFSKGLSFALDPFQVRACTALENGHGVLVCAPTGAGKTIVGEFAVHLALAAGRKCFYTTPIKALSNQKFNDLVSVYGPEKVGLLTGDSSINSDAPVVVMTTEVLRNMLYADSPALHGLSHVVMDEVHFLADRFRGAVWEEVILHLPEEVALASLSATVSNAEEFGGWIKTVRGDTTVVVDETRPVPLWQHVIVGRRLFDLFDYDGKKTDVDPDLIRYIAQRRQADRFADFDRPRRRPQHGGPRQGSSGSRPTLYRPPSRPEVITKLDEDGLLPAITFIFSRAGCDGAVAQCLRSRLRLTTEDERQEIVAIIDRRTEGLPEADLDVLGYWQWRDGLLRGIAAHHAGMLPVFRHTVEELFTKGLVRAVFATETLALGINMPARTVVLERLVKFNGEQHAALTPGEYTQLTGRAGRRGIDVEGHAVVLWNPELEPSEIAGLASTRTFPLRSSFAPSYNMTINLVHRMGPDPARELLERSFAQYQADRSVVGLVRGIERGQKMLDEIANELGGQDGSALQYIRLRASLSEQERVAARASRLERRGAANAALVALKRGDVIAIPHGRHNGVAVVLEPAADDEDPRPLVLTEHRWAGRISSADYSGSAESLGSIALPKRVEHRQPKVRRDVASALRSALDDGRVRRPESAKRRGGSVGADSSDLGADVERLRREIREHRVHHAPNRDDVARIGERYLRIERDNAQLQKKVSAATNSLARTFDRILALLTERGYIQSSAELGMKVTDDGMLLARIYSESDLLVAECLRRGLWAGLKPAELAAVASAVLYESRGDGVTVPGDAPTAALRGALAETHRALARLRRDEQQHHLSPTREIDEGFVAAVYRWATTGDLAASLEAAGDTGTALPAGDFVRWCRQVVDLLDQIHKAAPDTDLRSVARAAVADVRRGVVAVDGT